MESNEGIIKLHVVWKKNIGFQFPEEQEEEEIYFFFIVISVLFLLEVYF